MNTDFPLGLFLFCLLILVHRKVTIADGILTVDKDRFSHIDDDRGWSWDRILTSGETIVANGNVFPPPRGESFDDCLILVTRNQIMWHCPNEDGDHTEDEYASSRRNTVIFHTSEGRLRGAFSVPGSNKRRLWLLESPGDRDLLMELDTVTGEIMQILEIQGTLDGHDAVRVDDRIFIVDTRHGQVVEIELPASAPPYTESSIAAGAKRVQESGFVTIIKRHTGFARHDHLNNVAIHPQLLISNLHGGGFRDGNLPDTRLSALSRSIPEELGRELNEDQDGFSPVRNVGIWCHNIAFWKDEGASQIKLIGLDSMAGSLVSVVLSGSSQRDREILWTPDHNHPVLTPPEGVAKAYDNGVRVFTKGLAVQGGVAYFAASYARAPPLRKYVPESLLVAVDLATKEELWTRTIRSNGLINQIITQSYLGWQIQVSVEESSTELTYHGGGGSLVKHCEDVVPKGSRFCEPFEKDYRRCDEYSVTARKAMKVCCTCDGGKQDLLPLITGKLDEEIMKLDEEIMATATFTETHQCVDKNYNVKRLPLAMKSRDRVNTITNLGNDLHHIVKHICNVNVAPFQEHLAASGRDVVGTTDVHHLHDLATNIDQQEIHIQLINGFRDEDKIGIYQLPQLEHWLPLIEEFVLQPLHLPINQITRLMFTNIPYDSAHTSSSHGDPFVLKTHRIYIPISTHQDSFFLVEIGTANVQKRERKLLRIRSNPGEAYEFNNSMPLTQYDLGQNCVFLVLDWVEDVNLVKLSSDGHCIQTTQQFNFDGNQHCSVE